MNILVIQPWISYRGAESVSIEEVKEEIKKGNKATLLCGFVDWERIKKEDRRINYLYPPTFLPKYLKILFIFPMIVFYGRKYDLLNPHNFPSLWMTALANILLKKKIVWRVHNFPQIWFRNKLLDNFWKKISDPIDQWAANKCFRIHAVSEKVQQQIWQKFHLKSKVVYPKIDLDFFMPKSLVKRDKKLVLIASKINKEKSADLINSVSSYVYSKRPDIKFVIAGEGKIDNLSPNCKLVGWQTKVALRDLYRKSNLVFIPSHWGEGFNLVALEALACGAKPLVIKGSGSDKYLSRTKKGIVCLPDTRDISEKIIRYIKK